MPVPLYRTTSTIPLRRKRKYSKSQYVIKSPIGEIRLPTYQRKVGKYRRKSFTQKVAEALRPPIDVTDLHVTVAKSNCGRQGVWSENMCGHATQMQAIITKWGEFLVNSNNAPIAAFTVQPWSTWKLNFMSTVTDFLNSTNGTQDIEILVVTPKRDVPIVTGLPVAFTDPVEAWELAEQQNDLIRNANAPVYVDENTTYERDGVNLLGRRPYQKSVKQKFGDYWTICDKKKIQLGPGQMFKHYWNVKVNRLVNAEKVNTFQKLRNVNYMMIVIVNGQLFNGVDQDTTDISYLPAEVTISMRRKISFTPSIQFNAISARVGSLEPMVQAGLGIINPFEGAVDTFGTTETIGNNPVQVDNSVNNPVPVIGTTLDAFGVYQLNVQ